MIQHIKDYIASGLRIIPLQADKSPMKGFRWKDDVMTADDFENLDGEWKKIGLACGKVSGSIEVIDCDIKGLSDNKVIFDEFVATVMYMQPDLMPKITVQGTMNGGFHFIYRCEKIEGNKKLSGRLATAYELQEKPHEKVKTVLETRGEGGYIVVAPSEGYKMKTGCSLTTIQTISPEERDLLFFVARQVDRVPPEELPQVREAKKTGTGLSVFEDYNQNASIEDLIESSGWKRVGAHGGNIFYQRPGSANKWGATYHTEKKVFYVFTSSSEFQPEKGYNNVQVYTTFKCNGDYKKSSAELRSQGYGKDWKPDNDLGFIQSDEPQNYDKYILADDADDQYIDDTRNGLIKPGLSFGFSDLDKHFVYKQGDYVLYIGMANVGKTTLVCYLLVILCTKYPGHRWLMFTSENATARTKIDLMEFHMQKNIKSMTDDELRQAKQWIRKHFIFLTVDELYTLQILLDVARNEHSKEPLTGVFIDPYSMLSEERGVNGFQYHGECQNKIHIFKRKTGISPWVSIHAHSEAARAKDKDGFPKPPGTNDALHGVAFAGRADEVITVHRLIKHPERWMETQLHVHKVKDTKTGGSPTPEGEPIILRMLPGGAKYENELRESPFDSSTYGRLQPNTLFDGNINERIEPESSDVPF